MDVTHLEGGFADPARDAAHAFRAALQAMARPGRIEVVAGVQPPAPCSVAAGALILTLCDTTTPLFLAPSHDDPALRGWITFHTGAPLVGAAEAMFALGTWAALQPVTRFAIGTAEYPDRSATLIVEVDVLTNEGATLTGPGIKTEARLSLPETEAFRQNRRRFPLGFDSYFTCGDRLAGLPRSTQAEG
ncbi:phosphonate C-P lyase system protein PhnH [Roseicyclus persicicus]|uniref:Phosphonate C-P lyase system protein PhnH n=1 Tax=Roseicyclus persicicus TaxID=2650661 RepID=A0A7X6JXG6_9RHOB|nr:phosphonate C-P lyase system protein PhnH [Roseibacterium persicicum]NKX44775.1 phosphonate C-P lyase system protein PhnH [Roseibacterium persicicum]